MKQLKQGPLVQPAPVNPSHGPVHTHTPVHHNQWPAELCFSFLWWAAARSWTHLRWTTAARSTRSLTPRPAWTQHLLHLQHRASRRSQSPCPATPSGSGSPSSPPSETSWWSESSTLVLSEDGTARPSGDVQLHTQHMRGSNSLKEPDCISGVWWSQWWIQTSAGWNINLISSRWAHMMMFSYLTSSMYTQYCLLNQSKANQKLSGSSEYCISVSAVDALQWMGAVRMRVW